MSGYDREPLNQSQAVLPSLKKSTHYGCSVSPMKGRARGFCKSLTLSSRRWRVVLDPFNRFARVWDQALVCRPNEDQGRTEPDGGASLVTQRISDIEVSRLRLRTFLANRAIALGWALKGSCKPCAHRLFTTARWLVPEAQRFLLHRTGSHNRNRRIFELRSI